MRLRADATRFAKVLEQILETSIGVPRNVKSLSNRGIANNLSQASELLQEQGANPFRVDAYRHAAAYVENLTRPLAEVLDETGVDGLIALPSIGRGIAAAIVEMIETGNWVMLETLRGDADAESLLQSIPGIGPKLAARIHHELHVGSLEALRRVAYDGSLAGLAGVGDRRLEMIRACLNSRLRSDAPVRRSAPPSPLQSSARPSVSTLLSVDREYRERALRGELAVVRPRQRNPKGRTWLPIAHMAREGWHFTALFSNTVRAQRFGRAHDWVVIYCTDEVGVEKQYTVVTETRGELRGQRVVRGREDECLAASL